MAKPFLYYVAKDLIERYGNNLSGVTIVFPGKRARLYMNSFLSHIAQGPVWAPRFITIDELFQKFSPLTPSDNTLNVCRLYRIYARLMPNPESLDEFYSWGEILMNDFSDIDKHLVDAEKLFTNVAELMALDRMDYLSDEQIQALRQFFAHFSPEHQSKIKQRFMEMWQLMPQMYRQLKEELRAEGLMYKGALYREVVEKKLPPKPYPQPLPKGGGSWREEGMYAFVGFNVLDEVEEALFTALKEAGRALFYWDYDTYYAQPDSTHEAGTFLRHNLKRFPQALPEELFSNLISPHKRIRFLATSTDNAQVRYLPRWIAELQAQEDKKTEDKETQEDKNTEDEGQAAIVLCDEALMRPALHALPTEVNITMGYPITDTAIYGYFCALIDLQVEGYNQTEGQFLPNSRERLEKNPFFTYFPEELLPLAPQTDNLSLIDWLTLCIDHLGTAPNLSPLYVEATFQLHKALGQFRWLVTDGVLSVSALTLRRIIRQALAHATIPFHGETDKAIQMMGLLEARNLDFRHLVMLSVGEGIIPRRSSTTSLIPYVLRAHFGLDTTQRQDAVYAYSFYRLLQRAEDITLIYNQTSSGTSQREKSRFLRQLETETDLNIEQLVDSQSVSASLQEPQTVEKDEDIMQALRQRTKLSPTAINQYLTCPLKFYYQQVAHLRMPDRPQDGIDSAHFGTLFHDTCEHFYRHHIETTGRHQVLRSDIEPFIQHPIRLAPHLDYAFERMDIHNFTGLNMIIRDVIQLLVTQLLRWDMEHTPFTLFKLEEDYYTTLTVPSGSETVRLKVGGRIDRMDIMTLNGTPTLRVVDYKTGSAKTGPSSLEGIFNGDANNAHAYYLQTFLYALILAEQQQLPVAPCLFYTLSATDAHGYDPQLRLGKDVVNDIRDWADDYREQLQHVVEEIYNPQTPFVPTSHTEKHCDYCDFKRLCGKM